MSAADSPGRHSAFAWDELRPRLIWGAVLAVVAIGGVIVGGWLMMAGVAVIAAIVAREWAAVTRARRAADTMAMMAASAASVIIAGAGLEPWAILFTAAAATAAGVWRRSVWTAGGIAYASGLGISIVALRADPSLGLEAVFFLFAVVWATDIAAYFTGRQFGGPKLWPAVSPKKTWSGAIGGAVAAVAAGLVVAWAFGVPISGALVGIALLLSIVSQGGDLFESAVKRHFHTKDASHLIPGHGGLMDRVDGLAFASVAAALIGWLHGASAIGAGLLLW